MVLKVRGHPPQADRSLFRIAEGGGESKGKWHSLCPGVVAFPPSPRLSGCIIIRNGSDTIQRPNTRRESARSCGAQSSAP